MLLMEGFAQKTRPLFESAAKFIRKSAYADSFINDIFYHLLQLFRFPFSRGKRSSRSWCEYQKNIGVCSLPNGRFCSAQCMEGVGVAARCPDGYHPSHSWGYQITGCWCDTYRGRSIVCCDCTPITNSPYVPTAEDCGCMHYLDD
ncbi:hypothetical protein SAMN05421736_101935 [Evansella caseinilytica]|uniref:Uncharacterized protein n=1 Tax=Evansella caseinilytica TaxID=1503961 RepID=A0A1H3IW51_9BACI|nr:hypothetical protein SAMN05421736_101935 [Evansella caseinilytica]